MDTYMTYLNSLGTNDAMMTEWLDYKQKNYPYYPTYNYFADLSKLEIEEEKSLPNRRPDQQVIDCLKERLFNFKKPVRLISGICPKCNKSSDGKYCNRNKENTYQPTCREEYTPDEIKKRVYNDYIYHMYKKFKKEWKPKQDAGLGYMWLTINFAPSVTIHEAQVHASAIFNLKIFDRSTITYCYEFHGSGKGHIHIHALVELKHTGKVSFSALKDDILRARSRQGKLNIYLKMSWARKYEDRCDHRAVYHAYIEGNKTEDKLENIELDKIWRNENNLQEKYIKDNN